MVPFSFMKLIWKFVAIYNKNIKHIVHPIQDSFLFDSAVDTLKVLLIPTLWDNYSYIIISGDSAVIVDPSDFKSISKELKKRKLHVSSIILTHDHIDHVAGVLQISHKYKSKIITTRGVSIPGIKTEIENGFKFPFGDVFIEAVFVPGHYASPYPISNTYNNIAWYIEKAGVLFTGDTLFPCGYGCVAEGSEEIILNSLRLIRSLPDDIDIFCGHEYSIFNTPFAYSIDPGNKLLKDRLKFINESLVNHKPTVPTTLKQEKYINPFLRWDDKILKAKLSIDSLSDIETFVYLRNLKHEYHKHE